jgi:hypothetical protein
MFFGNGVAPASTSVDARRLSIYCNVSNIQKFAIMDRIRLRYVSTIKKMKSNMKLLI